MLARIAVNENSGDISHVEAGNALPDWAEMETPGRDEILQALQFIDSPAAPKPEMQAERFDASFDAMAELLQLADPEIDPGDDPETWYLPPPGIHTTGTQLRRRLVTPESIAELAESRRPSLLQRLLGRG